MKVKIAYMGAIAAALVAFAAGGIAQASPVGAHSATHHKKKHHKRKHHSSIPQHNGGDRDADNNGGPSDGDGNI
jgi:hypothetical protein